MAVETFAVPILVLTVMRRKRQSLFMKKWILRVENDFKRGKK